MSLSIKTNILVATFVRSMYLSLWIVQIGEIPISSGTYFSVGVRMNNPNVAQLKFKIYLKRK